MTEPNKTGDEFKGLVAGLGASVMALLQQIDQTGQPAGSGSDRPTLDAVLENARHLIRTLGVLEEKTKGNLSDEEQQYLASTIRDVKFAFVRLQEQAGKKT